MCITWIESKLYISGFQFDARASCQDAYINLNGSCMLHSLYAWHGQTQLGKELLINTVYVCFTGLFSEGLF